MDVTGVDGLSCNQGLCQGNPAEVWECLGASPPGPFGSKQVTFTVLDEASRVLVVGATVRVCLRLDGDCATPVTEATTDSSGNVTVEFDLDGNNYLEIEAPGYLSTIFHGLDAIEAGRAAPLHRGGALAAPAVLSNMTFNSLTTLFNNVTVNPAAGHLEPVVYDCEGNHAPGVRFGFDQLASDSVLGYHSNGFPTSDTSETDSWGAAVLVNAPAGIIRVTARALVVSEDLPPRSAFVRPGWFTLLAIMPQ